MSREIPLSISYRPYVQSREILNISIVNSKVSHRDYKLRLYSGSFPYFDIYYLDKEGRENIVYSSKEIRCLDLDDSLVIEGLTKALEEDIVKPEVELVKELIKGISFSSNEDKEELVKRLINVIETEELVSLLARALP